MAKVNVLPMIKIIGKRNLVFPCRKHMKMKITVLEAIQFGGKE